MGEVSFQGNCWQGFHFLFWMGYTDTNDTQVQPGINLSKEPLLDEGYSKGLLHNSNETEIHLGYEVMDNDRCGALGDCLGCNKPLSHEDVRRNTLIRRVMVIVFLQLVVVAGECSMLYGISSARIWIADPDNWWMLLIAIVLEFATLFLLFAVRKKFPLNIIALFLFTIATGYMVGSVIVWYDISTLIEAAIICMVLVGTLMLYTLITRTEVKWLGVFLILGLQGLIIWGLVWMFFAIFGYYSYWLYQLYCIFGVFLFTGFIVFDTARLMNKHSDPDEYILFAVNLYLDILNLFLLLLRLLGAGK